MVSIWNRNSLRGCNPHSLYSSIFVINDVISHQWILGDTSETKFIPKIASVLFPVTIFSISAWQATVRTRLLLTSHTDFFMFPPRWPSLIKVCLIRALIEVSNGKSYALTTLIAPAISSQIKSHYCFTLMRLLCHLTWLNHDQTSHQQIFSNCQLNSCHAKIQFNMLHESIKIKK